MYHWSVTQENPWALGQKLAKTSGWEHGTAVPMVARVVPTL